ncbi:MAG: alpha/beta hydrolase [Bacteroidetes bacterium]|nr:MAG: alpha/beta hydrolase [Bacteroidota bacterium]
MITMKHLHFLLCILLLAACQNSSDSTSTGTSNKSEPSGSLTLGGTVLKYHAKGNGTPLLIIGSSPAYFHDTLQEHFRMYFIDTRATAEQYSPINTATYTLETLLHDIDTLRAVLGLQKCMVGGHSIFGVVAFEYARQYPEHATHVVMIGSPSTYGTEIYQKAVDAYWKTASPERKALYAAKQKELEALPDTLTDRQLLIRAIVSQSPKRWHDPNFDSTPFLQDITFNTDFSSHMFGKLFASYTMFGPGEHPGVPTFIATGKSDYVSPPTLWVGRYDSLTNLSIAYFEASGHTPHREESALFNKRLIEWVQEH